MVMTAITCIVLLAAALRPLRLGWYGIHLLLIVIASYLVEHYYSGPLRPFSLHALLYVGCLHLILINIVTFCMVGADKRAARLQQWRIPEKTLFAFTLIGGTIGAVLGSRVFRHKTAKTSFRSRFLLVVFMQLALIAAMVYWADRLLFL